MFNQTCGKTCPFGTFKNIGLRICDYCHRSCSGCVGPDKVDCTDCPNTKILEILKADDTGIGFGKCVCFEGKYETIEESCKGNR